MGRSPNLPYEDPVLDLEARAELLVHLGKISRLEGQIEALIYGAREHNKKIEELEKRIQALELRSSLI